jgi:hypothetical protein
MTDLDRDTAMRLALAGYPPLPTDGQVIREAMSRLIPIIVSDLSHHWRKCPWRPCRRAQACIAPLKECAASPRAPVANIETTHAWLATRLREELLDILLERVLGAEEEGGGESLPAPARRASMRETKEAT